MPRRCPFYCSKFVKPAPFVCQTLGSNLFFLPHVLEINYEDHNDDDDDKVFDQRPDVAISRHTFPAGLNSINIPTLVQPHVHCFLGVLKSLCGDAPVASSRLVPQPPGAQPRYCFRRVNIPKAKWGFRMILVWKKAGPYTCLT